MVPMQEPGNEVLANLIKSTGNIIQELEKIKLIDTGQMLRINTHLYSGFTSMGSLLNNTSLELAKLEELERLNKLIDDHLGRKRVESAVRYNAEMRTQSDQRVSALKSNTKQQSKGAESALKSVSRHEEAGTEKASLEKQVKDCAKLFKDTWVAGKVESELNRACRETDGALMPKILETVAKLADYPDTAGLILTPLCYVGTGTGSMEALDSFSEVVLRFKDNPFVAGSFAMGVSYVLGADATLSGADTKAKEVVIEMSQAALRCPEPRGWHSYSQHRDYLPKEQSQAPETDRGESSSRESSVSKAAAIEAVIEYIDTYNYNKFSNLESAARVGSDLIAAAYYTGDVKSVKDATQQVADRGFDNDGSVKFAGCVLSAASLNELRGLGSDSEKAKERVGMVLGIINNGVNMENAVSSLSKVLSYHGVGQGDSKTVDNLLKVMLKASGASGIIELIGDEIRVLSKVSPSERVESINTLSACILKSLDYENAADLQLSMGRIVRRTQNIGAVEIFMHGFEVFVSGYGPEAQAKNNRDGMMCNFALANIVCLTGDKNAVGAAVEAALKFKESRVGSYPVLDGILSGLELSKGTNTSPEIAIACSRMLEQHEASLSELFTADREAGRKALIAFVIASRSGEEVKGR